MSKAVAMRPDLYAAYLHGASQWDGTYDPIAENGVAVYIFMAEMMNTMAPVRQERPMTVCGKLMRRQAGLRSRLMKY